MDVLLKKYKNVRPLLRWLIISIYQKGKSIEYKKHINRMEGSEENMEVEDSSVLMEDKNYNLFAQLQYTMEHP